MFALEPIACTIDNWGEGVVSGCREERPQRFISFYSIFIFVWIFPLLFSIDDSPLSIIERPSTALVSIPISENIDRTQHPSTGSLIIYSYSTICSSSQIKKVSTIKKTNNIRQQIKQEKMIKTDIYNPRLSQKESSNEKTAYLSSFEQKLYPHNLLVIHTKPPKVNKYNRA